MRHIFIINPAAGPCDGTVFIAGNIKNLSDKLKIEYEIFKTTHPGHATRIVHEQCEKWAGKDLRFYACGGDGTLNEVVRGIYGKPFVEVTNYPCGTGNDYIRVFGDDARGFYNLESLITGQVYPMDCVVTGQGIAINIASVGLDARIARDMQKYKGIFGASGQVPYIISTLENLLKPISRRFKITIDGKVLQGSYTLVLVANGKFYGGGFNPIPEASPKDGMLDVLLVKSVSRMTIAKVFDAYKKGKVGDFPQYATKYRCKTIVVQAEDKWQLDINLDGEVFNSGELVFSIGQHKIMFVGPKDLTVQ